MDDNDKDETIDRTLEGDWADGFVVMHTPPEGPSYCVGPFPPLGEDFQQSAMSTRCPCIKTIMPLGFPKGIRMAIAIDPEILDMARAMMEGPVH